MKQITKDSRIVCKVSDFGLEVSITYDEECYHYTLKGYEELPELIKNFDFY